MFLITRLFPFFAFPPVFTSANMQLFVNVPYRQNIFNFFSSSQRFKSFLGCLRLFKPIRMLIKVRVLSSPTFITWTILTAYFTKPAFVLSNIKRERECSIPAFLAVLKCKRITICCLFDNFAWTVWYIMVWQILFTLIIFRVTHVCLTGTTSSVVKITRLFSLSSANLLIEIPLQGECSIFGPSSVEVSAVSLVIFTNF